MAKKFYGAIGISGGSNGFLDDIDGMNLLDVDGALVVAADSGVWTLDVDSAAAQSIPTIMQPDVNGGDKRWILRTLISNGMKMYEAATTNLLNFSADGGDWLIDNQLDGGLITFQGENSGNSTTLRLDPAGSVDLYYDNVKQAETISGGLKATNSLTIAATTNVTGILDEDTLASDSAVSLATQQSIKAYVDNAPMKENVIINGDFNIWQRGTSFAAIASGSYTADRFRHDHSGDMVYTASRSTDVPTFAQSGHLSNYSLLMDCTTIDDAMAAGDYTVIRYTVEGYDFAPLQGNSATLSFWVKGTKTGIHCVSFRNSGFDKCYAVEYTINTTDTWEKKTITVPFTETDGTWDYTTGNGIQINFSLALGSSYHVTADTWSAGSYLGTSNQVNVFDSTDNNFRLAQVRLEKGTVAASFVSRPFAEELALCQRYFNKSYNVDVDPGTIASVGMLYFFSDGHTSADHTLYLTGVFPVVMRASATVTFYSSSSGTATKVVMQSGDVGLYDLIPSMRGFVVAATNGESTTVRQLRCQYTADADF